MTAIHTNLRLNQIERLAEATLLGIMGRELSITGKVTTRDEMMCSDLRPGSAEYAFGPVTEYDPLSSVPGDEQDLSKARQ